MTPPRELSTAQVETLLRTTLRSIDQTVREQIADLSHQHVPFDTGVALVVTALGLASSRAIASLPDQRARDFAIEVFTTTIRRETPIMHAEILRLMSRSH